MRDRGRSSRLHLWLDTRADTGLHLAAAFGLAAVVVVVVLVAILIGVVLVAVGY